MRRVPGWPLILVVALFIFFRVAYPEPIAVRYPQGSMHGFLTLKTREGVSIAAGEVTQTVHGSRVTSRLVFRFKDGSIDDDLTIFTQHGTFRLVTDHHIQNGPSFPKPIDVLVDMASNRVISRAADGKTSEEQMDLPADVSNGLPPNLLLNIPPSVPESKVSYVAPGAKPRLVHLQIKPIGKAAFKVNGMRRTATDFAIHVELGGLAGVVAPMVGKEPADLHIWIENGNPPTFVGEEGQLYLGGPIWRMEQASPGFPH